MVGYGKENRLVVHQLSATVTSFAYEGDGLKPRERAGSVAATLAWDWDDHLPESK